MYTDNGVWVDFFFFFLGDDVYSRLFFPLLLPFAVSVMADYHFSPPLEPQQEGQQLVAWELQTPKPLSCVCTSGIGG